MLNITENELKVQKAMSRDIGRNIIRFEESFMKKLDIKAGDIIEIIGKKQSVGIAWPGYPKDNGLGIIRIDARLRKNTGTNIGDTVEIHKIETKVAQSVVLTPKNIKIRNNPRFESFIKRKLNNIPITLEDYINISLGISREITFKVVSLIPEGICVIKSETSLHINELTINEPETYVENYDDIGGLEHQINDLKYILHLRSNHGSIVKRLNIEMPKGILFEGPPGTGKTLLARIIANDINFHFIYMIAPEIISKYQGESEKQLKRYFQEAEERSPSIIFIDHIDSIMKHRVLSQLLGLMDGLHPYRNVMVIAATHNLDLIEAALLRQGRFDKLIHFSLPDLNSRIKIYEIHTRKLNLDNSVKIEEIAELSNDFTGADIKGVCQLATINAVKRYFPDISSKTEELSDAEIDEIKLIKQDFLTAIKEIADRIRTTPKKEE